MSGKGDFGLGAALGLRRASLVTVRGTLSAVQRRLGVTAQTALFFLGCLTIVGLCATALSIVLWLRLNDLRRRLEKGLEALDRSVLGVGVTAGRTSGSLLLGQLRIEELTVENPEGYKSKHLLHAGSIELEIDLTKLAWHGGRHLFINNCKIFNLDAIVEKTRRSSNVHDVVKHLSVIGRQEAVTRESEEEEVYLRTAVANDVSVDVMARESLRFVIDEVKHCESADELRETEWRSICRSVLQTLLQEVSRQVAKRESASIGTSCAVGMLRAALDAASPPPRRPR